MTPHEALTRLKHGIPITCYTPDGTWFRIESKLSFNIAWYRTRPVRKGCLNRFSRLSDSDMLQWLTSVNVTECDE